MEAVAAWRRVTELAPTLPAAWYALGHAYNAVAQDAIRSFDERPEDAAWRQLLVADGLSTTATSPTRSRSTGLLSSSCRRWLASTSPSRRSTSAPAMRIGPRRERARVHFPLTRAPKRQAFCEFRAGRYDAVLTATVDRCRCGIALLAGARGSRARARGVRASRVAPRLAGTARGARDASRAPRIATRTRSRSSTPR